MNHTVGIVQFEISRHRQLHEKRIALGMLTFSLNDPPEHPRHQIRLPKLSISF
jgi:hypothetical protein